MLDNYFVFTNKGYRSIIGNDEFKRYNFDSVTSVFVNTVSRISDEKRKEEFKKSLILYYNRDIKREDLELKADPNTITTNLELFLRRSSKYLLEDNSFHKIKFDRVNHIITVFQQLNVKRNENDNNIFEKYNHMQRNRNRFLNISYKCSSKKEFDRLANLMKKGNHPAIIYSLLIIESYGDENMYDYFELKQPTKVREIYAPKEELKNAMKYLLEPLSKAYDVNKIGDCQYAYRKGLNIKDNAEIHKDYLYTVKTDIRKFFDTCSWELVEGYLCILYDDLEDEDIDLLKSAIINPNTGGLYQGNPVSGILSNAILRPSAIYLNNIFKERDCVISIYADDITVSSNERLSVKNVINTIEYVFDFYDLPFELHPDKTKLVKRNGRKITGVRINHNNELTIPRDKYYKARAIINHLKYDRVEKITLPKSTLEGKWNFYLYIDDTGKFKKLFEKNKDIIERHDINIYMDNNEEMI